MVHLKKMRYMTYFKCPIMTKIVPDVLPLFRMRFRIFDKLVTFFLFCTRFKVIKNFDIPFLFRTRFDKVLKNLYFYRLPHEL